MSDSTRSMAARRHVLGVLAGMLLAANAAWAAYPERPIRLIVPFSPGGGTDLIARTLGAEMGKDLGKPIVVENKPGAGTMIGTDAVAKSPADGYTILIASFAHAVNPSLQPKLPYSHETAFAPVILIGAGPNVLVVRAESPYRTMADLLAAAKANPGKLTYASQGIGTSAHLAGEMFSNLAKVELTHVPYKGAGPAITDVLGGQVDMMFGTAAATSGYVESGRFRALGVTSAKPSPSFEGVAPIGDTVPGYVVESWYGLYVAAGTPPEIVDRLNKAARIAARSAEFRDKVEKEGLGIRAGDPAELEAYVAAEEKRWRKVVRENHLKPN